MKQSNFLFCKNCHTPNSRPWMTFDDLQICSACRFHQKEANNIDWVAREEEFKKYVKKLNQKK